MSTTGTLENKVAIITGAAHGIGRATAERFAAEGARVTVADIDKELGNKVVAQIEAARGIARFLHTDVGVHEQVQHMIESTVEEWGRLDILVNNAYTSARGSVVDVEEADLGSHHECQPEGRVSGRQVRLPAHGAHR